MVGMAQTCHRSIFVLTALLLLSKTVVLSAPERLFELTLLLSSLQILFPNTLVLVRALRACRNKKMPLILSKEQVSRRQLGGWLSADLLDYGFCSPLMSVLSQVTALWVLLSTLPLPLGSTFLFLLTGQFWCFSWSIIIILCLETLLEIVPAESRLVFCLFWKKQLTLVVSRCINWTVKDKDHKRLNIIAKCFHFLNFELSSCICQTWSVVSSVVHRRHSPCRYKRLF